MKPGFPEVTISHLLCHSTPDTHSPFLCLQSTHCCNQYFWLPPISRLFPKSDSCPTVPTKSNLIYAYWLTTTCMLIYQYQTANGISVHWPLSFLYRNCFGPLYHFELLLLKRYVTELIFQIQKDTWI